MPVIQQTGKWFRIAIEQVWSYREDPNFASPPGLPPRKDPVLKLQPCYQEFKGLWEELGTAQVHLVDVRFEKDWQSIFDSI